jgi:post-segregation antitoxin (ccd killing protein)
MKICPSCGHQVSNKKKLTLSVDADLIEFAKQNKINISVMVENSLAAAKSDPIILKWIKEGYHKNEIG